MMALRNDLTIPEVFGTKALQIGAHSCYLRWTFLSTHSLSREQLKALVYEFKRTDGALQGEATFRNVPRSEFKARILGLEANTKYKFQIRCRLQHRPSQVYHRDGSSTSGLCLSRTAVPRRQCP